MALRLQSPDREFAYKVPDQNLRGTNSAAGALTGGSSVTAAKIPPVRAPAAHYKCSPVRRVRIADRIWQWSAMRTLHRSQFAFFNFHFSIFIPVCLLRLHQLPLLLHPILIRKFRQQVVHLRDVSLDLADEVVV